MANPRRMAVSALLKVENDTAYSNITLNRVFHQTQAMPEEKAFAAALFYGVIDRKLTLDYVLSGMMKTPLDKTAPYTLQVLRTGLYQILFMERVPASAAVNESVKLIKASRESRNTGFVNAVLRRAARTETLLPQGTDSRALSLRYSCPEWIAESFICDYGTEDAEELLKESLKPAPLTVRINTVKISRREAEEELTRQGIPFKASQEENALFITGGLDISENSLYRSGWLYAQDLASQKAAAVLSPKPDDRVLDLCAAPGGKSFTMAQLMENRGELLACDLYEHRVRLIADGARRLGLSVVQPVVSDAGVFRGEWDSSFDCVLCDVPCSGLGVLRRKPEIKYKKDHDFTGLQRLQTAILQNALHYVKQGGRLLYSTCTLRRAENEDIVAGLLRSDPGLHLAYEHTYMPHRDHTDGFYCALLIRD